MMEDGPVQHRPSSEEGVVAVLVAMLLGVFLILGALVLDVGALFTIRQDLVGDLDTAALAATIAAGDHVFERVPASNRCSPTSPPSSSTVKEAVDAVEEILKASDAGAVVDTSDATDDVRVECTSVERLLVTVEGEQPSPRFLATSDRDLEASGSTTARYVPPIGGTFLPLTVCGDDPAIADWLVADPVPAQQTGTLRTIELRDGDEEPCGEVPGNWGWFGSPNATTLESWIVEGIPDPATVAFDPPRCRIAEEEGLGGWCRGGPGLQTALLEELERYECVPRPNKIEFDCEVITLLVHAGATGDVVDALYEPVGFLDVRLRDVAVIDASTPTLEVEFRAFRTGPEETPFTPSGSYLCDVDVAPAGHDWCTQ